MKNSRFTNGQLNSSHGAGKSPPGARLRQDAEMKMKSEMKSKARHRWVVYKQDFALYFPASHKGKYSTVTIIRIVN